MTEILVISHIV